MNHPKISIVHATLADYPSIIRLIETGIGEWGREFLDDLNGWAKRVCTTDYLETVQTNGCLLIAVDENRPFDRRIVGTASGHHDKGVWVLGGIYVSEKKLGIGSKLVEEVLAFGAESGVKDAYSYVYENNHGSLRFLKRHGAIEVDEETVMGHRYVITSITLNG